MKVFYMVFFRNLGANRIIFLQNALHTQSEFADFIAVVCEHFQMTCLYFGKQWQATN